LGWRVKALRDFHDLGGYVAIVGNAVAGALALVAWRARRLRGRWVWIVTIVAEAMMMLQVVVGVILVSSDEFIAPRFHMFYGFLAFLTVGLAYQYRDSLRGRAELLYGLVGLFIMGLGIRAVLQVGS
jgi:Co/Zn/Cd efflux system component